MPYDATAEKPRSTEHDDDTLSLGRHSKFLIRIGLPLTADLKDLGEPLLHGEGQ